MKQRVGLHIRLSSSILEPLEKAQRLELPFFQCFFVLQATGRLIKTMDEEIKTFVKIKRKHFKNLICHGSYWINLASLGYNGYRALERELALAKKLEFTHLVLHPGTAKGAQEKGQGIDALARALNKLLKKEQDMTILLENTCHGNLAVGSDILDFKYLLENINKPEKIGFCIDTSHAHSYGYDISQAAEQKKFIEFLDETIGLDRIYLIHLNDTKQRLGSRIDKHCVIGEGKIGKRALQSFIFHPHIQKIPIIMELPVMSEKREKEIIEEVRLWNVNSGSK